MSSKLNVYGGENCKYQDHNIPITQAGQLEINCQIHNSNHRLN